MSILVTGGAGYIGSHCLALLKQQQTPVIVIDNMVNGHPHLLQDVPCVQADTSDTATLISVMQQHQVTAVMHFAAFAYVGESYTDPAKYYLNNITGTQCLLDAMRAAKVNQLIFSSTCATYGSPAELPITEATPQQPVNPYGFTKLAVEHMLNDYANAYGLNYLAFRYFNAAGAHPDGHIGEWHTPETHLIPLALQATLGLVPPISVFGDDYPTPDGTCIRDYIHVTDIATAHVMGLDYLQKEGRERFLNIGTGKGYSVKQILNACEQVTGKPVPHHISPRRQGDPAVLVADPSLIKSVLGWQPQYSELPKLISTAFQWEQTRQQLLEA
jgi:UDP-glucose 4-epimerase